MNKSVIIITITTIVFSFIGCTDILEKYPLDTPSQETFWTKAVEIERGINACYSFLQETSNNDNLFPLVLDCFTNSGYIRLAGDFKTIAMGDHDDRNGQIVSTWMRAYQGIGRCNVMLKLIEDKASLLTDAQKKQLRGEALFFRAYYHMRLIFYFGDVPLITSPVETVSEGVNLTRTPKEQVYQQIMDDFTEAAGLLELQYTNATDIGRVTRGTANAYKARAALYFSDFDTAAKAAKAVIESGVYQLYPKYGDLFVSKGLWDTDNKEILLKREYSATLPSYHSLPIVLQGRMPTGGWSSFVPSQQLVDSYYCIDGKNIAESPLFDKANPFDNRDPRLALTIILPGSRFGRYKYETHIDSTQTWDYESNTSVPNGNCYTASPVAVSHTGYLFRKYNDEEYISKRTQGDYPIILCRYAEVLLTYAEAKIELGEIDQSVIEVINSIRRDRDDVKMPQYTLSDLTDQNKARLIIRHERKIELAFEGFRYHDLKRWGLASTYGNQPVLGRAFKGSYSEWPEVSFDINGEPVYDYNNYRAFTSYPDYRIVEHRLYTVGKHELWPIPQRDLNINPNLVQNPGY